MTITRLFENHPEAGIPQKITDGLGWLYLPLPFRLNHVNIWLLGEGVYEGGVTGDLDVIDAGLGNDATRAIWQKILARDVRLRRALMTHFHPDHLGSGGWLESEHHAKIYMTEREFLTAHSARYLPESDERQQRQLFFHQLGLPDSETTVKTARSFYPTNTPTLPQRFVGLRAGDHIELGGRDWLVLCYGGHAPEQICLYHQDAATGGLFIAADQVLERISPNITVWFHEPEANPLGDYLASLREIRQIVPGSVLVLPSHGLPFHGLHERLTELERHHMNRLQQILEYMQSDAARSPRRHHRRDYGNFIRHENGCV